MNEINNKMDSDVSDAFRSVSAPSTPTSESRFSTKTLDLRKGHRVNFPEDHMIVTGYFDAPDPWACYDYRETLSLVDSYKRACDKMGITPISSIVQQLEAYCNNDYRKQDLSLKGEKLDLNHCEAIEEIFKRVQFRLIDLDSCELDSEGITALFEMIEYYESASHLSLSNNKAIVMLGWQAMCRLLKKASCLHYLDLRNTGLNEQILLILGRAIRLGSHLVTLRLENSGLYGRRLAILVAALKLNTTLKELYLGNNKISSADGVQIGNLLRSNSSLDLLDIRNNHIQDIGIDHLCEGLIYQQVSNDTGLKVLVVNNNQITSRGVSRLSETISQCPYLKALFLAYNYLNNDGISMLKSGLLMCKQLKYLSLRCTQITCEGSIAIAEFIAESQKIAHIDLRENEIQMSGVMAIAKALKHNKSIVEIKITENFSNEEIFENGDDKFEEILNDINDCCMRNKTETNHDDNDDLNLDFDIFSSNDTTIYNDYDTKSPPFLFSKIYHQSVSNSTNLEASSGLTHNVNCTDGSAKPIDAIADSSNRFHCQSNKSEIHSDQEQSPHLAHKQVMRSSSLGSWNSVSGNNDIRRSGRFSVSPVNMHIEATVKVEISPEAPAAPTEDICDKNDGSFDSGNENVENDELTELPKNIPKKNSFLLPESDNANRRRMSTPVLSSSAPMKTRSIHKIKICRNLESLDLKSSLPISPTFFARFEFPEIDNLRIPPEVEEFIANFLINEENVMKI